MEPSKVCSLEAALDTLSMHARVLVATDFDGTLAYFTNDPAHSELDPLARAALRKLSEMPNTFVAVISGRPLSELRTKCHGLERVRLVGSHGHEFDVDQLQFLTPDQEELLSQARSIFDSAVARCIGSRLEAKPHGLVFHFRELIDTPLDDLDILRSELFALKNGVVRQGHKVLEFSVVTTDKGDALKRLSEQLHPTITLFIGDDVTDEAAFEQLGPSDLSIKVGDGDTLATFRVPSATDAVTLIVRIADRRAEWMRSYAPSPIDRHVFLSDMRTVALVDDSGAVNWLCTPRIDGIPLFGALVGGPASGHYRISCPGSGRREYVGNTLIGRMIYDDLTVTDFFDCSDSRVTQRAGRSDFIRVIEGSGTFSVEFAPKFNFGRVPTRIWSVDGGLRIECGQQRLALLSPAWEWEITREGTHDVARYTGVLTGDSVSLVLLVGTASTTSPLKPMQRLLSDNVRFWEQWHESMALPDQYRDLVSRSALVIRGLCYGPTGAIAAAATTSLPESIGGSRNWDYRYCWPRDASLSASAMIKLNAKELAMRTLDWILSVTFDAEDGQSFLAPLYTVTGGPVIGEAEVTEAIGYRGSRPVRIGNLAADQLQLDTLGPIAELMWKLAQAGASLMMEHLELTNRLVGLVESRWMEVDSGIWEVRSASRHFVHSKLMCWYTVHCCGEVSRYLGVPRDDWAMLAGAIRTQIETEGFSEELNSYIAAYDLPQADAALLWIVLTGFHPPDHPRSIGTVRFVQRNLVRSAMVYRYHFDDSLKGQEGEFIICRSWLIEALTKIGDRDEAQRMFDEVVARIGPLGLISEEWDEPTSLALGNYPQAYSHLGIINAACALGS